MDFGISWSISTITYREPLLWVAVILGAGVSWLLTAGLGRLIRRKAGAPRSLAFIPLVVTIPIGMICAVLSLGILFSVIRGGNVCAYFVRPAFFLPPVTAVFSAVRHAWSKPASIQR